MNNFEPTEQIKMYRGSSSHLKHLLDETHVLLKELTLVNSPNISAVMKEELIKLDSERRIVIKELETLQNSYRKIQAEASKCKLDLLKFNEDRDVMETHLLNHTESVGVKCLLGAFDIPLKSAEIPQPRWLIIGIPTLSRKNHEDYLLLSIEALATQLPDSPSDLMYGQILVNIVNIEGSTHRRFYEAKEKYAFPNPKSIYFSFLELSPEDQLHDPVPNANIYNDIGNANHPGYRVRKQTRDIVTVMKKSINLGKYYLFLEDDMRFCPSGLLAIQYLLSKASLYHPNWFAIRASYGMNGIFIHNSEIETFSGYLLKHQKRRPPDHLVVEWYAGETSESAVMKAKRANIGFRYNLFDHIGAVSTLRPELSGSFPHCYDELLVPTVFEVEAFNPVSCPQDDVWPCHTVPAHSRPPPLDWSSLKRRAHVGRLHH